MDIHLDEINTKQTLVVVEILASRPSKVALPMTVTTVAGMLGSLLGFFTPDAVVLGSGGAGLLTYVWLVRHDAFLARLLFDLLPGEYIEECDPTMRDMSASATMYIDDVRNAVFTHLSQFGAADRPLVFTPIEGTLVHVPCNIFRMAMCDVGLYAVMTHFPNVYNIPVEAFCYEDEGVQRLAVSILGKAYAVRES